MIFTKKEKRTTFIALGAGAAILMAYYVFLPLWNRWTALGAALEPKVRYLEMLRQRAHAQNALLARRDELAKKLGAVEGREGQPGGAAPAAAPPAASSPPQPGPTAMKPNTKPDAAPPAAPSTAAPPAAPAAPPAPSTSPPAATSPAEKAKSPAATDAPKPPPKPPAAVALATYIERQANAAGIRVNSITPTTPSRSCKEGKSFTPVGLQVNMETMSPALIKLLRALEKGDRFIRIEHADIRHDIKKGQNVTATLYIVGYESSAR